MKTDNLFKAIAVGIILAALFLLVAEAPAKSTPLASEAAYVPRPANSLTFTKDIAPIIFRNCAECHRPGEVAPFSLLSYQDVKKRGRTIVEVTGQRFMPPWKAEHGFGEFHNERRLTADEIGMLKQWFDEGAPEGNATDLPPLPKFHSGWTLGEPDLIFQPTETYELAAEGRDEYRCFVIPTNFTEDKWVSAVQVQPGNRTVVHHVIAYVDTTGRARQLDAEMPGPGYVTFGGTGVLGAEWLDAWVPGKNLQHLPDGLGKLVPKGSDIILQVHYHRSGKAEKDLTRFGLYFCQKPVEQRVRVSRLSYNPIRIEPGDANYRVSADMTIPADVTVLGVAPHMHLLGREMTVKATLPNGATAPMVRVPDWDFNWQLSYAFKEPLKLPRGSKVDLTARFDNSTGNPNNPSNPPKFVRWGEQTTDEMCIAFFTYTVDGEKLSQGIAKQGINRRGSGAASGQALKQLIDRFDTNKDGKVDEAERKAAFESFRKQKSGGK
ncbi:MAG: ascorbate-dependent monooxygenase [Verrucomicrobiota bacterium]